MIEITPAIQVRIDRTIEHIRSGLGCTCVELHPRVEAEFDDGDVLLHIIHDDGCPAAR